MPTTRGAGNPPRSRKRRSACTDGVHGPERRWTVSPTRTASLRFPPSGISSGMHARLSEFEVAERLGVRDVPRRADVLRHRAHPIGKVRAAPELRFVPLQRTDLLVEGGTDVEPDVRLTRSEEQHACDAVLLQLAVAELLGEEQVVASRDHA